MPKLPTSSDTINTGWRTTHRPSLDLTHLTYRQNVSLRSESLFSPVGMQYQKEAMWLPSCSGMRRNGFYHLRANADEPTPPLGCHQGIWSEHRPWNKAGLPDSDPG
jgi:hypothetical protein